MKTIKRLDNQDKPGYFLKNMTNINVFDPEFVV